jgi:hypothetical protein
MNLERKKLSLLGLGMDLVWRKETIVGLPYRKHDEGILLN